MQDTSHRFKLKKPHCLPPSSKRSFRTSPATSDCTIEKNVTKKRELSAKLNNYS